MILKIRFGEWPKEGSMLVLMERVVGRDVKLDSYAKQSLSHPVSEEEPKSLIR